MRVPGPTQRESLCQLEDVSARKGRSTHLERIPNLILDILLLILAHTLPHLVRCSLAYKTTLSQLGVALCSADLNGLTEVGDYGRVRMDTDSSSDSENVLSSFTVESQV